MEIHTYDNDIVLSLQILPYFTQWKDINMYKKVLKNPIKFKLLNKTEFPEILKSDFLKSLYQNYKLIRDKTLWHECMQKYIEENDVIMTDINNIPKDLWQHMLVILNN